MGSPPCSQHTWSTCQPTAAAGQALCPADSTLALGTAAPPSLSRAQACEDLLDSDVAGKVWPWSWAGPKGELPALGLYPTSHPPQAVSWGNAPDQVPHTSGCSRPGTPGSGPATHAMLGLLFPHCEEAGALHSPCTARAEWEENAKLPLPSPPQPPRSCPTGARLGSFLMSPSAGPLLRQGRGDGTFNQWGQEKAVAWARSHHCQLRGP